jgi:hypothetical protein
LFFVVFFIAGKTCERVEKRVNVKVATTEEQAVRLHSSYLYRDSIIYNENLILFHMGKRKITYNKPVYVGAAVLDISKCHMYGFYYNYVKPKYGNRVKICYKDTDSLTNLIQTEDLYEDLANDPQLLDELDTSSYPPTHPLYSTKNKLVLGKFKDEAKATIPRAFVGLRSKEYAKKYYRGDDEEEDIKKKSKGTKKSVVQNQISFEDYERSLRGEIKGLEKTNYRISSRKGEVSLIKQEKKCLNPEDKKRYIMEDGISTLAWGHFRIPDKK